MRFAMIWTAMEVTAQTCIPLWATAAAQGANSLFLAHGVESEARMRYYFAYAKSGFETILRMWLECGCRESPRDPP